MAKILHNRYDADGNVIEQYWIPVKRSNETDTDIYITKELLYSMAAKGHKGDTHEADYADVGKTVWYRDGDIPDRQVVSMACKHCGNLYEVTFIQPSGYKIEVLLPVK